MDSNRRRFLMLCASAGGGLLMSGASAVPGGLEQMCRTRPGSGIVRVNAGAGASTDLVIAGTRLFKEGFLDEVLPAYEKISRRTARMLGGGCDDGVAGVRLGSAVLGGICCPIEQSPAIGMKGFTVARDMKVIVAHPSVVVDRLSLAQIKPLLTGETLNWRALGGPDQAISLVVYDHCPDYLEPVRRRFLGNRPIWSPLAMVVKTDQKHLETLSRFEGAVGVNSWILAEPFVRQGKLKVLAIDGVAPTLENAARGHYPLTGPLTLIFNQWNERNLGAFFEYLYSPAGQGIIGSRAIPVRADQAGFRNRGRLVV
jgi:phosphate transport system substrate-binding protein